MVNIMAFKIHNKYKYFIHFPKKPYLCKTNKQDSTGCARTSKAIINGTIIRESKDKEGLITLDKLKKL